MHFHKILMWWYHWQINQKILNLVLIDFIPLIAYIDISSLLRSKKTHFLATLFLTTSSLEKMSYKSDSISLEMK